MTYPPQNTTMTNKLSKEDTAESGGADQLLPQPGTPALASPTTARSCSGITTSSSSGAASDDDEAATPPPTQPHPCGRFAGSTVLVIAGGTRGDVQPAAALGVALAGEGARVRLAADAGFAGFVASLGAPGLEFYPLGGNAREMMALTVKWGGMLPTEMSGMFWLRSQIREVMDYVWRAATDPLAPQAAQGGQPPAAASHSDSGSIGSSSSSGDSDSAAGSSSDRSSDSDSSSSGGAAHSEALAFKPDLILANQLAYGQVSVAEKLGVPLHVLYTIPWLPTSAFPHPWARAFDANIAEWANAAAAALLAPLCGLLGLFGKGWGVRLREWVLPRVAAANNRMSTPLLDNTAWSGIADILSGFRRRLGLPLLSANNLGSALYKFPTTCLFSPGIVPKPGDWPSHVTLAGFLSLPESLARYSNTQHDDTNGSTHADSSTNNSNNSSSCGVDNGNSTNNSSSSSSSSSSGTNNSGGGSSGCVDGNSTNSSSGSCQRLSSYVPPADLQAFLSAGPAPIYVGFGSMVVQDPQALMQLVLEAGHMLQDSSSEPVRMVVCSGWSGEAHAKGAATAGLAETAVERQNGKWRQQLLQGLWQWESKGGAASVRSSSSRGAGAAKEPAGCCSEVFFTSEVPHEWLFPRCRALVHHGGVGTTAVGLKHGKPTLVIAAFGDLFFWGDACAQLGAGPPPLPLKGLTAAQLGAALQALVGDPAYQAAAARVAAGLNQENGLEAALLSVHRTLCRA